MLQRPHRGYGCGRKSRHIRICADKTERPARFQIFTFLTPSSIGHIGIRVFLFPMQLQGALGESCMFIHVFSTSNLSCPSPVNASSLRPCDQRVTGRGEWGGSCSFAFVCFFIELSGALLSLPSHPIRRLITFYLPFLPHLLSDRRDWCAAADGHSLGTNA